MAVSSPTHQLSSSLQSPLARPCARPPARLPADIYGPDTVALVTLRLGMKGWHDRAGARRFVLNWRVPAWADERNLSLSVNGKTTDACSQGARASASAAGEGGADVLAAVCWWCGVVWCA